MHRDTPRTSLVSDPSGQPAKKRRITAVPEPTEGNPLATFGANEWLVDEMYEQYKKDPNSVDRAWWDFFEHYGNGASARRGRPRQRRRHRRRQRPRRTGERPPPSPRTGRTAHAPRRPTAEHPGARPRSRSPRRRPKAATAPVPKEPPPPEAAEASDEPTYTVLRGAPARTVAEHGRQPRPCPPRPASARCRSSCCGTTGS